MPLLVALRYPLHAASLTPLSRCLCNAYITIKGNALFDLSIIALLLPRKLLVEFFEIVLRYHLPNGHQELLHLFVIQDAVVVSIKQLEVLLILLLLFDWNVLLNLFLAVSIIVIQGTELCDLRRCRYLWQIVIQRYFLTRNYFLYSGWLYNCLWHMFISSSRYNSSKQSLHSRLLFPEKILH